MSEIITDRHREIFKNLSYFNKLIHTISLSNNTLEDKMIYINRVKKLTNSVILHVNSSH
jgi:hypothetical protein